MRTLRMVGNEQVLRQSRGLLSLSSTKYYSRRDVL